MRQKSVPVNEPATQVLKNVRRATRRHFSAEDKIRIVLEGLRGEDSIAELCRREGIVQNQVQRASFQNDNLGRNTCLSTFFVRLDPSFLPAVLDVRCLRQPHLQCGRTPDIVWWL